MTVHSSAAEAIADARGRQLAASTRTDAPPDPDAADRAALRELGRISVGAGVADALLATASAAYVVPLDPDTLTPTREPFFRYRDVLAHYNSRYADGAGMLFGAQRVRARLGRLVGRRCLGDRTETRPPADVHQQEARPRPRGRRRRRTTSGGAPARRLDVDDDWHTDPGRRLPRVAGRRARRPLGQALKAARHVAGGRHHRARCPARSRSHSWAVERAGHHTD